jgi:hypothetical protein
VGGRGVGLRHGNENTECEWRQERVDRARVGDGLAHGGDGRGIFQVRLSRPPLVPRYHA